MMKRARDVGKNMAAALYASGKDAFKEGEYPRVRLASSVDMTKADPECDKCKGSGVETYIEQKAVRIVKRKGFRDRKETYVVSRVPVVCDCVVRNLGVAKDALDSILEGAKQRSEARQAALSASPDVVIDADKLAKRGGYSTVDDAWTCSCCGKVVKGEGLHEGVPLLPRTWFRADGWPVCSDVCWQKTKDAASPAEGYVGPVADWPLGRFDKVKLPEGFPIPCETLTPGVAPEAHPLIPTDGAFKFRVGFVDQDGKETVAFTSVNAVPLSLTKHTNEDGSVTLTGEQDRAELDAVGVHEGDLVSINFGAAVGNELPLEVVKEED